MLGGRSNQEWIAQYASSHQHPVNRACHTLGIPTIVISLVLLVAGVLVHPLLAYGAGLFIFGWVLQFIGHAFERKEPEFFHDWRFLFVGVRWWWAKVRGRA
ncbi:MAG TPA: Mpo1-like protein [Terriglobales bacterium]|nr:Mpo1-like protein [Terriglobales bacterium]